MEEKAEGSGRSIRLGTPRSLIRARMTLLAAQTGLWNAFALATWMNGVHGNTARRDLKIVPYRNRIDSGRWCASSLSFPAHALDLQLSPTISGFLRCPTAVAWIFVCPL